MIDAASRAKDNLFGVCDAIGKDLEINPLWLRLLFASAFIFDSVTVIASYLALGAFVVVARLLFPPAYPTIATAEIVALPAARHQTGVELANAA